MILRRHRAPANQSEPASRKWKDIVGKDGSCHASAISLHRLDYGLDCVVRAVSGYGSVLGRSAEARQDILGQGLRGGLSVIHSYPCPMPGQASRDEDLLFKLAFQREIDEWALQRR